MLDETSIVDRHRCHMAAKFVLFVDKDHSKPPMLYWLPKRHKRSYKSRFISNSSAFTTTELSILLTSCLTAIINHVIKYYTVISCLFVVWSKLLPRGAVDDLMHYCTRPKAECNSASGRPRYRGVIV